MLTHSRRAALPLDVDAIRLDSRETLAHLARTPASNPTDADRRCRVFAEQAAYVAYTAGTTGPPRGSITTHHALGHWLSAAQRTVRFETRDRVLAVSTPASDMAFAEILLPLVCGASVVLVPAEDLLYPAAVARLMEQTGTTVLHGTPRVLRSILHCGAGVQDLRCIASRDALTPADAAVFGRGAEIVTVYGTTETTIWNCATRGGGGGARASLGRPLSHSRMYVLDEHLQPVPAGIAGDLYVGGACVSRGYLHEPGNTAASFVADPHGPPGMRMFRTGDLVRWTVDGVLELIGRRDDRLTPSEIADIDDVRLAVQSFVGVYDGVCVGGPKPIAYVVPYRIIRSTCRRCVSISRALCRARSCPIKLSSSSSCRRRTGSSTFVRCRRRRGRMERPCARRQRIKRKSFAGCSRTCSASIVWVSMTTSLHSAGIR